eukprot:gnl/MRDRNA2_/MRDRNA2_55859_c0_seq1.p1 gnl/MRDRNA2_/MRDRNA2_55859_c0~~gnl/MRDRNA2_/MRDRNA2_55859_c0_seq1.p1  ORF type:complete len:546 (-),score=106.94 gnl/MRDRNA2_/MRDRNA2_55859_c0_seq1:193-1830(-)
MANYGNRVFLLAACNFSVAWTIAAATGLGWAPPAPPVRVGRGLQLRAGPSLSRARHRRAQVQAASHTYDYDLLIIGCGVGGHGAALHAVDCGMKVAVLDGKDVGGTCVNRGCVPSKALLAASGRVREMQDQMHLAAMGVQVGSVSFNRQGIADHASKLAATVQGNLQRSLESLGVKMLSGKGSLSGCHKVSCEEGEVTAENIIIATGSEPFVPPSMEVDGMTVFTSDHALKLHWIPKSIAIVGSGYIGMEFADVYTALGSEVTFIEALPDFMPYFDREIAKLAERILVRPRNIKYRTGVLASKVSPGSPGRKPVVIELSDTSTKEVIDTLEVDACLIATGRVPYSEGLHLDSCGVATTSRGFVPVNDHMQVLDEEGEVVDGLWCIGDVNGKMMLAHAASAQGISAVENMQARTHIVNHLSVPAACFTHPEISFAGLTEEQAQEQADLEGFELAVARSSFKANSKALAEGEPGGICKVIYRKDTGEILGVHILGIHAADLIHEASNAIATGTPIQDLKFMVHAHPTLAEVLDETFKEAKVEVASVA